MLNTIRRIKARTVRQGCRPFGARIHFDSENKCALKPPPDRRTNDRINPMRRSNWDRTCSFPQGVDALGLGRRVSVVILCAFFLLSCGQKSPPVAVTDYAAKIVGRWEGAVGDAKEVMSLNKNGQFVCKVLPTGFIANTLSQGVTGTIRGTWTIAGAMISLKITGAENETVANRATSSSIVALNENTLVLKSEGGGTSSFQRASAL